jgi:hypothetical protein
MSFCIDDEGKAETNMGLAVKKLDRMIYALDLLTTSYTDSFVSEILITIHRDLVSIGTLLENPDDKAELADD